MYSTHRANIRFQSKTVLILSIFIFYTGSRSSKNVTKYEFRDGEVPSQKELSSYFEELFSSKVPRLKELSSSNEELFPNPVEIIQIIKAEG